MKETAPPMGRGWKRKSLPHKGEDYEKVYLIFDTNHRRMRAPTTAQTNVPMKPLAWMPRRLKSQPPITLPMTPRKRLTSNPLLEPL